MHPNVYAYLSMASLAPVRGEMPDAGGRDLLTPDEAADILRLARQTLARWRVEGVGPAFVKLGSRVAYRRADIETWLANRRVHSTSEHIAVG